MKSKSLNVKKVAIKDVVKESKEINEVKSINFMKIVAQDHPDCGEDYALQLWYKTYKDAFAKCTSKTLDEDLETAHLVINEKHYIVNIRTGKINLI